MSMRSALRGQAAANRLFAATVGVILATIATVYPTCGNLSYLAPVAMILSLMSSLLYGAPPKSIGAERLADLPNTPGVAAPYVGVAGDAALIVAGGTNFPDAPPWKNGTKTWHDAVYVLPSPDAQWLQGFKLPRRMAYGVSLTIKGGLLCIGGCDEKSNLDDVFVLRWDGKRLTRQECRRCHTLRVVPPAQCSAHAFSLREGKQGRTPQSGHRFLFFGCWTWDDEAANLRELPTWPGPESFYAIAGSDGNRSSCSVGFADRRTSAASQIWSI